MSIQLADFLKNIPAAFRKKTNSCVPRECDEVGPNRFVAFVDEDEKSYDVSVEVTQTQIITASCECGGNISKICRHIASLILYLQKEKKSTSPRNKKREKQSPVIALLQSIDEDELRKWVGEVLQHNKDLELAFTRHFAAAQASFTPAEVQKLSVEALKATLGRRTKADPTEMKKLVDLLKKVYEPFFKKYYQAPYDPTGIEVFNAIVVSLEELSRRIVTSGNRLMKFMEQILTDAAKEIQLIEGNDSWQKAIMYFVDNIVGNGNIRTYYLKVLDTIVEQSSRERQLTLAGLMVAHYKSVAKAHLLNYIAYTKTLFALLKRLSLIGQHLQLFVPIRYELPFNIDLISALVAAGDLATAEKYAVEQVNANVKQEYDLPYLHALRMIYTAQGRQRDLATIVIRMIPFTWNYEDYKWLSEKLQYEEWQPFRSKITGMAGRLIRNYNRPATEFYYQLLEDEGKTARMLDYIDSIPYMVIAKHFHAMYAKNRAVLLTRLLDRYDDYWTVREEWYADEAEAFEQLFGLIIQTYGQELLLLKIKEMEKSAFSWRGARSRFALFLNDKLLVD